MKSLKGRLTTFLLIGITALLAVSGFALEQYVESWLERQFDAALLAKARALITLTKGTPKGVELDFADEFMPEFEAEVKPEYFQIWLDGYEVLERSNSLASQDLHRAPLRDPLPDGQASQSLPVFRDVELPDHRIGRQVQIDFFPQVDDDLVAQQNLEDSPATPPSLRRASLVVAKSRQALDSQQVALRLFGTVSVAALATGISCVVFLALAWGLRPLEDMRRQLEALDERNLTSRLKIESAPEELQSVIGANNRMLHRLQLAFERERRLASNVAHELRTPIAELRSLAEVGVRWPDDPQSAREFFRDTLEISVQMEQIVVNLLALARYDGGLETVDLQELDVLELLGRCWQPHAEKARARGLVFDLDAPISSPDPSAAILIRSDRTKLGLILTNLFSNAVAYAEEGTAIRCIVRRQSATNYLFSVINSAPNLRPPDVGLMFDRFWRKDTSRSGGQNVGLGLSLVGSLAELLALELDASLGEDGLLAITLQAGNWQPETLANRDGQPGPPRIDHRCGPFDTHQRAAHTGGEAPPGLSRHRQPQRGDGANHPIPIEISSRDREDIQSLCPAPGRQRHRRHPMWLQAPTGRRGPWPSRSRKGKGARSMLALVRLGSTAPPSRSWSRAPRSMSWRALAPGLRGVRSDGCGPRHPPGHGQIPALAPFSGRSWNPGLRIDF